jgi:hypothetical protein
MVFYVLLNGVVLVRGVVFESAGCVCVCGWCGGA